MGQLGDAKRLWFIDDVKVESFGILDHTYKDLQPWEPNPYRMATYRMTHFVVGKPRYTYLRINTEHESITPLTADYISDSIKKHIDCAKREIIKRGLNQC